MELTRATTEALLLTRELCEALEAQDLEPWLELLDRRGAAMAAFDTAHRNASDRDRDACRDDIMTLRREDRALQDRSEILLDVLAGEFREQLGASQYGNNSCEQDRHQACLDRKA